MTSELLLQLSIIFGLVFLLSLITRFLKLPSILAYILAGVVISIAVSGGSIQGINHDTLSLFSKIGIAMLLFILGLELKINELKSVGVVAIFTGLGQIVFTSVIGYLFAILIGFGPVESAYIAIALTFSSTIVIVKLLSDKRDISSLYGKIAVGFLLIQDFVAILALVVLSGVSSVSGQTQIGDLVWLLIKTFLIFGFVIFLSIYVMPKVVKFLSKSLDNLFVFSIAWAFGFATLLSSNIFGLSIEIGGFLAGFALSSSKESLQIVSRIRALRDFFIILFFVNLGLELEFANIGQAIIPAVFFSLFVLIGNPLIVMVILRFLGYKSRTGFLAGLTVAQISEFSLILIALGNSVGQVSELGVSVITLVGIITFAASSYMIMNGEKLYVVFKKYLKAFDRKSSIENNFTTQEKLKDHIVLVGADHMGHEIIKNLKHEKDKLIIIDFNPFTVEKLLKKGYNAVFGDIVEDDVQEHVNIEEARFVISTIPTLEDNVILVQKVKSLKSNIQVYVSAGSDDAAKILENVGADMIIQPLKLSGMMLAHLTREV